MGADQGPFFDRKVWKSGGSPAEKPCEWDSIRCENWVPVAHVTKGFSAVENGLWRLSSTLKDGCLGKSSGGFGEAKTLETRQGRAPSLLIIDAQSVKTSGKGEQRGFDGGKKVKGRKRQIVVDTQGNLHKVFVHKANIHDSKGDAVLADIVLTQHRQVNKSLRPWVLTGGFFEEIVTHLHKKAVEFSSKMTGEFVIQPKRWIVERTIA